MLFKTTFLVLCKIINRKFFFEIQFFIENILGFFKHNRFVRICNALLCFFVALFKNVDSNVHRSHTVTKCLLFFIYIYFCTF